MWDIAYVLYCFAPFSTHKNIYDDLQTINQQIERAKLFLGAYDMKLKSRGGIANLLVERLNMLIDFMFNQAKAGDIKYIEHINTNHDLLCRVDIEYIKYHENMIDAHLSSYIT